MFRPRKLVLMFEPPAPAGADHAVRIRSCGFLLHSAAEFSRQRTGESKAELIVIEKNDGKSTPSQYKATAVIQQMFCIDLGVGQWLMPGCIDRDRFLECTVAKRGGDISFKGRVTQLLFELAGLADAAEEERWLSTE